MSLSDDSMRAYYEQYAIDIYRRTYPDASTHGAPDHTHRCTKDCKLQEVRPGASRKRKRVRCDYLMYVCKESNRVHLCGKDRCRRTFVDMSRTLGTNATKERICELTGNVIEPCQLDDVAPIEKTRTGEMKMSPFFSGKSRRLSATFSNSSKINICINKIYSCIFSVKEGITVPSNDHKTNLRNAIREYCIRYYKGRTIQHNLICQFVTVCIVKCTIGHRKNGIVVFPRLEWLVPFVPKCQHSTMVNIQELIIITSDVYNARRIPKQKKITTLLNEINQTIKDLGYQDVIDYAFKYVQ